MQTAVSISYDENCYAKHFSNAIQLGGLNLRFSFFYTGCPW